MSIEPEEKKGKSWRKIIIPKPLYEHLLIPIDKIRVIENIRFARSKYDVDSLAKDIEKKGLMENIGVSIFDKDDYVLCFGSRRLDAFKKLGWEKIPAKAWGKLSKEQIIALNMSENNEREDVGIYEQGNMVTELTKMGYSPEEISYNFSIPLSRVKYFIKFWEIVPLRHKKHIAIKAGIGKKSSGVPLEVAVRISGEHIKHNISKEENEKLWDIVYENELTTGQVNVLLRMVRSGISPEIAFKNMDEYSQTQLKINHRKDQMDNMIAKHGLTKGKIILGILNGEIPAGEIDFK